MPQMSPLLWFNLFFYFLIMFMLFNCEMYYLFIFSKNKFINMTKLMKKNNFKW